MMKPSAEKTKDEPKAQTQKAPTERPTMTHQTSAGGVQVIGAEGATQTNQGGHDGPSDS